MKRTATFYLLILLALGACKDQSEQTKQSNKSPIRERIPSSEESPIIDSKKSGNSEKLKTKKAIGGIKNYFEYLNRGNYEAASKSFAAKVNQWITIKNTTPRVIAAEAKRFLSSQKGVKYTPYLKDVVLNENTTKVVVRQQWAGYDTTLEVWLEFDKDLKITAYKEGKVLKKLSVEAARLEALIQKNKKGSLPLKISDETISFDVVLNRAEVETLGVKNYEQQISIGARSFYGIAYFELNKSLMGILYCNQYGTINHIKLAMFNRQSGKFIDSDTIVSWGYEMVGTLYYVGRYSGTISIDKWGKIISDEKSTQTVRKTGETTIHTGVHIFKIMRNGEIKSLGF
ncbi:hypothetical protein BKI52_42400 [marine bacterium AO1-C]|nr:hypothetical protein BKI52_42400 [marine bacterium AO1-C]